MDRHPARLAHPAERAVDSGGIDKKSDKIADAAHRTVALPPALRNADPQ